MSRLSSTPIDNYEEFIQNIISNFPSYLNQCESTKNNTNIQIENWLLDHIFHTFDGNIYYCKFDGGECGIRREQLDKWIDELVIKLKNERLSVAEQIRNSPFILRR